MPITRSPRATMIEHPRDVTDRAKITPWGLCVHTTGSSLPRLAKQRGIDPVEQAIALYTIPDNPTKGIFTSFPHYVIGWHGDTIQIADDRERARHAGIEKAHRALYVSGAWKNHVSQQTLALWRARWSGRRSPLQLFPSKSVNEDYLGCELIPLLEPLSDGGLFTDEQYDALAALCSDVEDRYRIRLDLTSGRLVGHEDLEPLARWDRRGGWDPGALRTAPVFFWDRVVDDRRVTAVG